MDKITYSIISRGELKIKYKGKSIIITGELIFNPPIFYADLIVLEKIKGLNYKEKKQIVEFIKKDSLKNIGTEIIFD
ncbi:hypothetical protein [Abyssalbus ytuae]|uniref:Uncharacterized protein n=1 Tax=Abyssalbus ytuae TaxID=2926907 RepID=A0A9E6ZMJ5_9FLAO|nr:hypothetical protein [Abyssalbus ytuae]UOB17060.1 hypothetical protein MQE35_15130 [Abyssalbus ytuae]